jgi:hypothetical protein
MHLIFKCNFVLNATNIGKVETYVQNIDLE